MRRKSRDLPPASPSSQTRNLPRSWRYPRAVTGESPRSPSERRKASSSSSPRMGGPRSIERIVNPLLRVSVYCVQYTISDLPNSVQDQLYALIDQFCALIDCKNKVDRKSNV